MTAQIIIFLAFFAALFIAWFYFTVKITPENSRKKMPKWARFLLIACGLLQIVTPLFFTGLKWSVSVGFLLFGLGYVYLGLEGWIFKKSIPGDPA